MRAFLTILTMLSCLAETSCASADRLPFGPVAPSMNEAVNLKPERVEPRQSSADLKEAVWRELDIGNGKPADATITPANYTAAGYSYVYRQCSNYFDTLILYQNKVNFANDEVVTGGSSLGAVLGLVKASSAAVGAVAAGVGFVSSSLTAFNNRALITPYPNETKTMILNALDVYRSKYAPNQMTSASEAILNVQHFAELCTYSGITRAAKQALSNYKGDVISSSNASTPTIGAVISANLGITAPLDDAQLVALYWFIFKGGSPCADAKLCAAAVSSLAPIKKSLIDSQSGYIDPADLKAKVGGELSQLYADDAAFKKAVDTYGAAPEKGAAKTKPTIVTKPPVSALSNRFDFTIIGEKSQAPAVKSENFGQFDFSRPQNAGGTIAELNTDEPKNP